MIYVILQFVAIIFLIFNANYYNFSYLAAGFLLIGIIAGVWAILAMKLNNLSVRPSLKSNHQLRTTSIYRYIAHPMYTSVLLQTFALLLTKADAVNLFIYSALFVILFLKSKKEEQYLSKYFAHYLSYRQSVGRFLPKMW